MEIVPLDIWFPSLVSDCSQIIEEAKIKAGMVLVEAKYDLGKRILVDYKKFGSYNCGKTQKDLAEELGMTHQAISESVRFATKIKLEHDGSFNRFSDGVGKLTWREIVHDWIPKRENPKQMIIPEQTDIDGPNFLVMIGDFRERGAEIPDNSVHLVLTDPPYGEQYLDLWAPLSELASRVLVPGGFLVTYSGHLYLPHVIDSLNQHLEYFWMCSLTLHNRNLVNSRNIYSIWKPILMFYKEPLHLSESYLTDLIEGSGREKNVHKWQQAEQEIDALIKKLSPEGGIVLDPMAGSGTTLASALRLNRKAIGIDLDPRNINGMRERLG